MRILDSLHLPLSLGYRVSSSFKGIRIGTLKSIHPRISIYGNNIEIVDLYPFAICESDGTLRLTSTLALNPTRTLKINSTSARLARLNHRTFVVNDLEEMVSISFMKGDIEIESLGISASLIPFAVSEEFLLVDKSTRILYSYIDGALERIAECSNMLEYDGDTISVVLCKDSEGVRALASDGIDGVLFDYPKDDIIKEGIVDVKVSKGVLSLATRNELILYYIDSRNLKIAEVNSNTLCKRLTRILSITKDEVALLVNDSIAVINVEDGGELLHIPLSSLGTNSVIAASLSRDEALYLADEHGNLIVIPFQDPVKAITIKHGAGLVKSVASLGNTAIVCGSRATFIELDILGSKVYAEILDLGNALRQCIALETAYVCIDSSNRLVTLTKEPCETTFISSALTNAFIIKSSCVNLLSMDSRFVLLTPTTFLASHRDQIKNIVLRIGDSSAIVNVIKTHSTLLSSLCEFSVFAKDFTRIAISASSKPRSNMNCILLRNSEIDISNYLEVLKDSVCINIDKLSKDLKKLLLSLVDIALLDSSSDKVVPVNLNNETVCFNLNEFDTLAIKVRIGDEIKELLIPACIDYSVNIETHNSTKLSRSGCAEKLYLPSNCIHILDAKLKLDHNEPILEVDLSNQCDIPIPVVSEGLKKIAEPRSRSTLSIRLTPSFIKYVDLFALEPLNIRRWSIKLSVTDFLKLAKECALRILTYTREHETNERFNSD